MYVYCVCSRYTLHVCTSTNAIVTLYRMKLSNPYTPRKYTVLKGNFVLNLHDIFQEHNPVIK